MTKLLPLKVRNAPRLLTAKKSDATILVRAAPAKNIKIAAGAINREAITMRDKNKQFDIAVRDEQKLLVYIIFY